MTSPLVSENLFDFFNGRLAEVSAQQRAGLSKDAHIYLANMLVELADPQRIQGGEEPPTLADMHLRAANSPPELALRRYKELGDYALYMGGYFGDSLERKIVGVEYYADMGGSAFHRVAGLSAVTGHLAQLRELFRELACTFRACLGVLAQVSDQGREKRSEDLGRLYERWLTTGDPHTHARLLALGVVPTKPTE